MPVYGAFALYGADESNLIKVGKSGSFEGLHVELQYYGKGDWGCETNGLVLAMLCRDDTNDIRDTYLVTSTPDQAVLLLLRDDTGKVVPLRKGIKFKSPPPTLARPLDSHVNQRIYGVPCQIDSFCVDSLYTIQHAGEYELEGSPRFYRWTGPSLEPLPLITNFPPVKIRLHLDRNDGG